jgi:protein disulfide-isomerase
MRLLPISLLCALFASVVISESTEQTLGNSETQPEAAEDIDDGPVATTFNGVKVPALPELDGEKFNSTVKEGYWFIKHYS